MTRTILLAVFILIIYGYNNTVMTTLQAKAFHAAKKSLNPKSRWYKQDLMDLRLTYSLKSDAECQESLGRLNAEVSESEIRRNCQLDGLL